MGGAHKIAWCSTTLWIPIYEIQMWRRQQQRRQHQRTRDDFLDGWCRACIAVTHHAREEVAHRCLHTICCHCGMMSYQWFIQCDCRRSDALTRCMPFIFGWTYGKILVAIRGWQRHERKGKNHATVAAGSLCVRFFYRYSRWKLRPWGGWMLAHEPHTSNDGKQNETR